MTAEAAPISRSWKVGPYICTLKVSRPQPGAALASVIEWAPSLPHNLSPKLLAEYRAGRNAAVVELARELGGSAVVVEL